MGGGASGSNVISTEKGGGCVGGLVGDGGVVVSAIDIYGGRHGGDAGAENGHLGPRKPRSGRAEMRTVVGGPEPDRNWVRSREGYVSNTIGFGVVV